MFYIVNRCEYFAKTNQRYSLLNHIDVVPLYRISQTMQSMLFKYFNNGVFIKLYTYNRRYSDVFKGATSLLNILHWNIYRLHYKHYWLSNMRNQILGCVTLAMLHDIRQSIPSSVTLLFRTRRLLPVAIAKSARVWHKRNSFPVYWRKVSTI